MGKPVTLLEKLCAHALKFGAQSIAVEYKDGGEWVFVPIDGTLVRVALFLSGGAEAKELRGNLVAAAERPVRTVIDGRVYIVKVRIFESFGENAFEVSIVPAPKLDPSERVSCFASGSMAVTSVPSIRSISFSAQNVGGRM